MSELTERQRQCLDGAMHRKTAKQIGRELGITHHAVEQHLKAARRKLGAVDTGHAARMYAATLATNNPYYRATELSDESESLLYDRQSKRSTDRLRDVAVEGPVKAYALSPWQTLIAIAVCALGLVAIVSLIIAIAQGVAQLAP